MPVCDLCDVRVVCDADDGFFDGVYVVDDDGFVFWVEGGSYFVEQVNVTVEEDCLYESESLFFSAGEVLWEFFEYALIELKGFEQLWYFLQIFCELLVCVQVEWQG